MLYISYKNDYTDNNEDERKKKVIEFLENILLDKKIEKIIIQDPYLYGDDFYEIFITKTKKITDLNIGELGIWDALLYKLSDLDVDEDEKNIKIISTKQAGNEDIICKIYKKIKLNIFLGKRNIKKISSEKKIHDRFILLKTFDNNFFGIHISLSLNDISQKDILLTTISRDISEELFYNLEKKFDLGDDNNE
jgi:hypothetical protein